MAENNLKKFETSLKKLIVNELETVTARVDMANSQDVSEETKKELFRLAHAKEREEKLNKAHSFLVENEDWLIEEFANGNEIDPSSISPQIIPVQTKREKNLFRFASLSWSVPVTTGYGRRTSFLVKDRNNNKLIGIFAFRDPVIGLGPRDEAIGWTTEQRHQKLTHIYDAYVLGAVEPYRQLLGGKLMALATLSNETTNFLIKKYEGKKSIISETIKDPTPVMITTTSALGRSSVYNRIKFNDDLMFRSIGYTAGHGTFQFSEELFQNMKKYLELRSELSGDDSLQEGYKYSQGANWKFRVIRSCLKELGLNSDFLNHGIKREIFIAPVASNWQKFLRGENKRIKRLDLPMNDLAEYYRNRWAVGRGERKPDFQNWNRDQLRLTPNLRGATQLSFTNSFSTPECKIGLGNYEINVGVNCVKIEGLTPNGERCAGESYLSSLKGSNIEIEISDTTWSNGERDIRGVSNKRSTQHLDSVIDHLNIEICDVENLEHMAVMELKKAAIGKNKQKASIYKTSLDDLTELFGFDLENVLDLLGEAVTGTKESLLKDESKTRGNLCTVFFKTERVVPVLVWSLLRPISLLLDQNIGSKPAFPVVNGRPPKFVLSGSEQ